MTPMTPSFRCRRFRPAAVLLAVLGVLVAAGPAAAVPGSPRFTEVGRLPDGRLRLRVTGPGGPTVLQASPDLRDWRPLVEFATGDGVWTESIPDGGGARFFRALSGTGVGSDFTARAVEVRSASVRLEWAPPVGATATRVYLSPEPGLLAAGNPARRLLAEVPGDTAFHRVAGLAAGVDAFFRIECDTPAGIRAAGVHARTAGGPRATLETRLREVHGYAPTILQVTLADGPVDGIRDGWTVRRGDGAEVGVLAVHRNSVPVSAPDYPLGLGGGGTLAVRTDHRIFLVLAEPLGEAALLDIRGPGGLAFTLPFSDRYLETPVIQLNQVGFNPRARQRWAYVSGWMGDGGPLDLGGFPAHAEVLVEPESGLAPREARHTGLPVTPRKAMDVLAGTEVRQIDLAGIPVDENARLRVRLPGIGVSWRTMVSEKAAFKAFYTVARGLFHNRWAGDLRPDLTEWSRPSDHVSVFTSDQVNWAIGLDGGFPFREDTPRVGARPLRGGHHDAGDFDLRPFHTYVAQELMRAYEIAPEAFPDGQLNLPESGNGIPDLLDEALWSIASWEQLQEDDGGVRLGVESWRHPANQGILAHTDDLPYWTYGREPNHSARCAGLFAQAARLVMPFDAARAEALRVRAVRALDYAIRHGAAPGLRLHATGELYRLTRDPALAGAFESIWRSFGEADWESFQRVRSRPLNPSDYLENTLPDVDHILAYFGSFGPGPGRADDILDRIKGFGLRVGAGGDNEDFDAFRNVRPWGYSLGWGQAVSQGQGLWFPYAALQVSELSAGERQRLFDGLSLAADFILGGNPLGMVFITGLGTRRVEEPLHLDSLAFIKMGLGPIPGIPVYGPTGEHDGVDYVATTMAAFHPPLAPVPDEDPRDRPASTGHPYFRRYADVRLWVRANEFSVAEVQAPHAQLFAVLMMGTRGVLPPASFRPGGADHRNPWP